MAWSSVNLSVISVRTEVISSEMMRDRSCFISARIWSRSSFALMLVLLDAVGGWLWSLVFLSPVLVRFVLLSCRAGCSSGLKTNSLVTFVRCWCFNGDLFHCVRLFWSVWSLVGAAG